MTAHHYSPRSVTIVLAELSWIVLSLAAAISIDLLLQDVRVRAEQLVPQVLLTTLLYVAAFYYADLYNFSELQLRREWFGAVIRAFSVAAVVFGTVFLCTQWLEFRSATLLIHLLLTAAVVAASRNWVDTVLKRYGVSTRIAIVGAGAEGWELAREIMRRQECGHDVVCFFGTERDPQTLQVVCPNPGVRTFPVLPTASMAETVKTAGIKRILVATADLGADLPVGELLRCKTEGYEVEDGHTFYERLLGRIRTAYLEPEWLIFSDGFARSRGVRAAKRVVDLLAASVLVLLTAPLCAVVAIAIKLEDRGPVLYNQPRVGRKGRLFSLRKFRSMRVDAEAQSGATWAADDDGRVTRVGRWIRKLRIDEIPQAWNVLLGEMSFVGPRPERPEFVASLRQQIPFYDQRLGVKPGITGWA